MLVEPDLNARLRLGTAVARRSWSFQTARIGEEALAIARWFEPTVIVLDLHCPDIPGYELAERLRATRNTARSVIIGIADRGASERVLSAPVDALLTRPFAPAALFDTIEMVCERRLGTYPQVPASSRS